TVSVSVSVSVVAVPVVAVPVAVVVPVVLAVPVFARDTARVGKLAVDRSGQDPVGARRRPDVSRPERAEAAGGRSQVEDRRLDGIPERLAGSWSRQPSAPRGRAGTGSLSSPHLEAGQML